MDCIITREDQTGLSVVHVSGALTQAQIPDLLKACADARGRTTVLDLVDLVAADTVAVHALRRLRSDGARLTHASQHIQLKLDE